MCHHYPDIPVLGKTFNQWLNEKTAADNSLKFNMLL